MAEWFFAIQNPASVRQNPSEQLLFKNDQSSDDEYAGNDQLVREIIQNSLDAKKEYPVRVRLALFSKDSAPSNKRLSSYFSGLESAVTAKNSTILFNNGIPELDEGFLVCEDFNTRGLEGDPNLTKDPTTGICADFFWFWRNIGRSGKTGADLGRWGLGKTVYRAASRIGAMLGLTVRASDHCALAMGQAVLAIHKENGQEREAAGFWGRTTGNGSEKFVIPVSDSIEIERFCKDWRLTRGDAPGLSVVVPYAAEEINANQLAQAVVVNFFVRILRGELSVEIEAPNSFPLRLTKESILNEIGRIKWDGTRKNKRDQVPPLDFINRCLCWQGLVFESKILGEKKVPDFKESPFDSSDLLRLQQSYQNGDLTAVNINLYVGSRRSKPREPLCGSLRVFLQKIDDKTPCNGYYVRSGMTITKISPSVTKRGVQALVLVEDGPLADFLGDTEGASHEDWLTTEKERIEQKWTKKTGTIGFVKFCRSVVDELVKLLTPTASEANYDLLSEYFSDFSTHKEGLKKRAQGGRLGQNIDEQPYETIESNPKWFAIREQKGGFQVVRNINEPLPLSPRLRIQVAYDVSQGDPLKKWSHFDFDFMSNNFRETWNIDGLQVQIVSGNEIIVYDIHDKFKIKNVSFDSERDLFVRVEDISKEIPNN